MSITVNGQGERDIWYFGQKAGMQFNLAGNPSSISDNTIERRIVFGFIEGPDNLICANNEEGDLMFYSDGRIFRNREHENMLNSPTDEYSVYYADAAISRDPGNDNRYYVFVNIQDGLKNYLTYTVVNMELDDGLGGLEPDNTHVVMINDVAQHMVVARHGNGRDRWLVGVRRGQYYAYLITENGIATTPVVSGAGVSIFDGNFVDYGTIEVSPNNDLLAATYPGLNKLFLLEFNNLNGRVKFLHEYEDVDDDFNEQPNSAVEFSANGEVLYYGEDSRGIKQFDISDIENIPEPTSIVDGGRFPYLKRGPNGKIYTFERGNFFVGAINNPDVLGLGCNFEENVQGLTNETLLDFPAFLLPKYPEGIYHQNICLGESTEFNYSAPVYRPTYIWDLGDGTTAEGENIEHTYSAPGTYTASVEVYNDDDELMFTDTKEITIYDTPVASRPDDLFLCTEDNNIFLFDYDEEILNGLDPNVFSVSYYFSEIDALLMSNEVSEFTPEIGTQPIWVRVENSINPSCFDMTNFSVITPEYVTIDMPTKAFICDENGATLSPPDGFISYEWSTGDTTQDITVFNTGQYVLTAVKDFGDFVCEAEITIVVNDAEAPIIEDIKVFDWSQNHNSIKVTLSNNTSGEFEYSVDGANWQSSPDFYNLPIDDYTVYVRDVNCLYEVSSERLFLLYYDKFFTPNDDGVNDYWQIINSQKEEDIEIHVVNRYGRTMAILDYNDQGWDGRHNGVDLPSDDYWFRVVRNNGDVHFGHFTLKR